MKKSSFYKAVIKAAREKLNPFLLEDDYVNFLVELCSEFEKVDPSFDANIFLRACGVDESLADEYDN